MIEILARASFASGGARGGPHGLVRKKYLRVPADKYFEELHKPPEDASERRGNNP